MIKQLKQFVIKTTIWLVSFAIAYLLAMSVFADNEMIEAEKAFHDTARVYNYNREIREKAEQAEQEALRLHQLAQEKLRIIKEQRGLGK